MPPTHYLLSYLSSHPTTSTPLPNNRVDSTSSIQYLHPSPSQSSTTHSHLHLTSSSLLHAYFYTSPTQSPTNHSHLPNLPTQLITYSPPQPTTTYLNSLPNSLPPLIPLLRLNPLPQPTPTYLNSLPNSSTPLKPRPRRRLPFNRTDST